MQCYTPLKAQRCRSSDGSYYICFKGKNKEALQELQLPCGRCMGCRLERSRQWATRCMHEAQLHEHNVFITLTFNEQKINDNYTLVKSDFQNFIKRLRKLYYSKKFQETYPNFLKGKIRYFHCGEYGENFSRPHHHACLFNCDFPDKKLYKKTPNGDTLYTSEILNSLWHNNGFALIGNVTFESAAYVARYCTKKINGSKADEYYAGRTPEYMTCSKKPAIGKQWLDKFLLDVFPSDEIIMRGKKMRVNRYYEKYLEKSNPDMLYTVKSNREDKDYLDDAARRIREYEVQQLRQQTISRNFEEQSSYSLDTYDKLSLEYLKHNKENL